MEEIWKDLTEFEGLYQVSNTGFIKSMPRQGSRGGIMKGYIDKKGYIVITLRKDGHQWSKKLHRLIAQEFLPNPKNLSEINHKDENKLNNHIDNLEWCTTQYNNNYGTRTERASKHCGKPIICVETGERYQGAKWAGQVLNLDPSGITKACKNPNRTVGGYHWKYIK